jgi:trimethylamine:corrinoid methyltransferase-like protein
MPNRFGAVAHIGNHRTNRNTITPQHESIHAYATIMSLKRGSKRESFRSLPDTVVINNRTLPMRWVA